MNPQLVYRMDALSTQAMSGFYKMTGDFINYANKTNMLGRTLMIGGLGFVVAQTYEFWLPITVGYFAFKLLFWLCNR